MMTTTATPQAILASTHRHQEQKALQGSIDGPSNPGEGAASVTPVIEPKAQT